MREPMDYSRLAEKIGYEMWLLEFIGDRRAISEGQVTGRTITLRNRSAADELSVSLADTLGGQGVLAVLNATSPTVFVTCYCCVP